LSPGRMRMKFLRIFPETCASTWCLLSNSTRNMAFGSGSTTVAITSIASSLLIRSLKNQLPVASFPSLVLRYWQLATENWLLRFLLRQNYRAIFGYGYTVLKVRTVAAIHGDCGPFIVEDASS